MGEKAMTGTTREEPDLQDVTFWYLNKEIGLIAFKAKLRDLGMTEDEVEEYIDDLAGDADADED